MGYDKLYQERKQRSEKEKRRADAQSPRPRILIVCEGERTEPAYFNALRQSLRLSKDLIDIRGEGMNTQRLVDEAKAIKKKAEQENLPYDKVWIVMDKDSFGEAQYLNAIRSARAAEFHVAWSNEAFELWYLLHYEEASLSGDRQDYTKELSRLMGKKYAKNDQSLYALLKKKQDIAFQRARELEERNRKDIAAGVQSKAIEAIRPSTSVQDLVDALESIKPISQ